MLLQGDALSVQLFIGAAAISALSIGMTQAGWTHKWFVRAMFGLAVVLAALMFGWSFVETHIPTINASLQTAASSRMVWFVMGLLPAFTLGILTRDTLRNIGTAPHNWMRPITATETLARQDLLDRARYVRGEAGKCFDKLEEISARIETMERAIIYVGEEERAQMARALAELVHEQSAVRADRQKWNGTADDCEEALRLNIHHQLVKGTLVAKGLLSPHVPGQAPRIIPKEEWRLLSLDWDAEQAVAPNFQYEALTIGKPRRQPLARKY